MSTVELAPVALPDFGMSTVEPAIPDATYEARIKTAWTRVQSAGLDALVVYADREHFATPGSTAHLMLFRHSHGRKTLPGRQRNFSALQNNCLMTPSGVVSSKSRAAQCCMILALRHASALTWWKPPGPPAASRVVSAPSTATHSSLVTSWEKNMAAHWRANRHLARRSVTRRNG